MLRNEFKELTVGKRVAVTRHRVGARRRRGEVLEVIAERGHERCRIRWDDGEESIVYPGPDVTIERQQTTPGEVRRRPS